MEKVPLSSMVQEMTKRILMTPRVFTPTNQLLEAIGRTQRTSTERGQGFTPYPTTEGLVLKKFPTNLNQDRTCGTEGRWLAGFRQRTI